MSFEQPCDVPFERGLTCDVCRRQGMCQSFVATSPAMVRVAKELARLAKQSEHVMLVGEQGTGRSTIAALLHRVDASARGPLSELDVGSMPDDVLLARLADARGGRGTIVLHGLWRLSLAAQSALVRNPAKLGPHRLLVACTPRVDAALASGELMPELFFLLRPFALALPALRDRTEDLPELALALLRRLRPRLRREVNRFSPDAIDALQRHRWPGNLRELENAVRHAVAFATDAVELEHLPSEIAALAEDSSPPGSAGIPTLERLEREHVRRVLELCDGRVTDAARILGISRGAIYRFKAQLAGQPYVDDGTPDESAG